MTGLHANAEDQSSTRNRLCALGPGARRCETGSFITLCWLKAEKKLGLSPDRRRLSRMTLGQQTGKIGGTGRKISDH